jgi:thymidine phosphorylase
VLAETIAGVSREALEGLLDDGSARRKFEELVAAQGGNPDDLKRLGEIHQAPLIRDMLAPITGTIEQMDAGMIGQAALQLGAGRAKAADGVDFAVGFDQLAKVGEGIHAGRPICRIHARTAVDFDMAEAMLEKAVKISSH